MIGRVSRLSPFLQLNYSQLLVARELNPPPLHKPILQIFSLVFSWVNFYLEQPHSTAYYEAGALRVHDAGISWCVLGSADVCWDQLMCAGISWCVLGSADVCWDQLMCEVCLQDTFQGDYFVLCRAARGGSGGLVALCTVNLGLVSMKYIFPDSILIYLHRENKILS